MALWGSFGMSLLLPVAAVFVLRPFGVPPMSLAAALTAVVVGSVLGAAARPGCRPGHGHRCARHGAAARPVRPARVGVPTALNLVQCVGLGMPRGPHHRGGRHPADRPRAAAAVDDRRRWHRHRRWRSGPRPGSAAAPLGGLAGPARVRVPPRRADQAGAAGVRRRLLVGFWLAVDVVVALPISWAPLAADYARHSRSSGAAFGGAFLGYGVACMAYFASACSPW